MSALERGRSDTGKAGQPGAPHSRRTFLGDDLNCRRVLPSYQTEKRWWQSRPARGRDKTRQSTNKIRTDKTFWGRSMTLGCAWQDGQHGPPFKYFTHQLKVALYKKPHLLQLFQHLSAVSFVPSARSCLVYQSVI